MHRFYILSIILSIVVIGCRKDKNNGDTCYSNVNAVNLEHNGIQREYVIYVPSTYNGATSVPMVINFHGFGGSASDYMIEADMRQQAEADTFILVYPQGSCLDGSSHWNACPLGGDNKSNADDFGFVETMVNHINNQYFTDLSRVYAVGYSNGGMMAYGLANYKSELIAAVASVSGAMLDCIGTTSHPMPVIHLHGTADDVLQYAGSADWSSVQSTLTHWINFNNTVVNPLVSTDNSSGMTIEKSLYDQGDSLVSIEHYKYIGGGHVWFNNSYQGHSTSDLVWNFLSKYDLGGLR